MASSKAKTTMNKLNRERKLREKRMEKESRKTARQNGPADQHLRVHDLNQVHGADLESELETSGDEAVSES